MDLIQRFGLIKKITLLQATLKSILAELGDSFVRIHKSYVVNSNTIN